MDKWGGTPLIAAAMDGDSDTVEMLIGHGADLNVQDDNGYAALHAAVEAGNKDTVAILVDHNPQRQVTENGETPTEIAQRHGNETIRRMLCPLPAPRSKRRRVLPFLRR